MQFLDPLNPNPGEGGFNSNESWQGREMKWLDDCYGVFINKFNIKNEFYAFIRVISSPTLCQD